MNINIYVSPREAKYKKGCNALHNACANGDMKLVKELIYEKNYNFYKLTNNLCKVSALHYALYYERLKIIDILLEAYRIDLEVIKAIKAKDDEPVLLAFGDQVDKVIEIGSKEAMLNWSPVLLKRNNSVKPDVMYIPDKPKSRSDILIPLKRVLKANGFCDLNSQESEDSPLHIAVYFKMYSVVQKLLELGADYKYKIYDQSPLVYACYYADINLMKILCKDDTDFWQTANNANLAIITAVNGSFKTFEYILDKMVNSSKVMSRDECLRKIFNSIEPIGEYDENQTFIQTLLLCSDKFPFLYKCLSKYREYIDATVPDKNGDTIMHYAAKRFILNYSIPYIKKLIKLLKEAMLLKNKSGKLPVHVAAISCYNVKIFKLFYYGTKCNFFQDFDFAMNIIVAAIEENNTENVRFLIRKNPEVLTRGAPYISYAMINNEELVDELLAIGIDPNIIFNGTTAFMQAATYVDDRMLRKFLKSTQVTDVNFSDSDGRTVLLHICRWCSEEMFDKWMSLGADPFVVDNNGYTCLHQAVSNSNGNIIKKLLDLGVNPLMRTNNQDTAIMLAISCNNKETFRVLFNDKMHLDLHARNKNGDTLLHLASTLHQSEIFESILSSAIDINAQNSIGNTALHKTYFIENVKQLIAQGADYKIINSNGDSVLYHSVSNYQDEKAIYLLKSQNDLDLTIKNNQGFTFLMLVTQVYGDKKYSEILKHSKYDRIFSQLTTKQVSAMPIEYINHLMRKLIIRSAKLTVVNALMIYLVEFNFLNEVRMAIKRGANINQVNPDHLHGTCLNCAISSRNYKLTKELLELGSFIDLPNQNGVVPLQLAMTLGDYDIIDLLLKNNASTEKLDITKINKKVLQYFNYLFE